MKPSDERVEHYVEMAIRHGVRKTIECLLEIIADERKARKEELTAMEIVEEAAKRRQIYDAIGRAE